MQAYINNMKRYIGIIICFCWCGLSLAQEGIVRGSVYDAGTGEPVSFASVLLYGTDKGGITDDNGYFSINKVAYGTYSMRISCIGYDSLLVTCEVSGKDAAVKKYYLTKKAVQLGEVEVTAEKMMSQTETRVSVTHITTKKITSLPSVGGMPDLAQYLQVLPGVVFTGDQGGQLYLRGGTPIQNKILLDGMMLYNPFHSIGMFSVFDVDILKGAEVYTAGFGAEYGGRTSSVIDVKIRDGNQKRVGGKFDLNTFGAKIMVEGPLYNAAKSKSKKTAASIASDTLEKAIQQSDKIHAQQENSTAVTFLLSLKGSYLSKTSQWLYPYANKETGGLPYDFLDGYGKISLLAAGGSRVSLFGFSFNDRVKYPNVASYHWKSYGGGLSFVLLPRSANMLMNGTVAYSSYDMKLQEPEMVSPKNSKINALDFRMNFSYLMGKSTLTYGLELTASWIDYNFTSVYNWKIQEKTFNSEAAAFVKYKWVLAHDKLILEPSFRLHIYASQSAVSPEPRLALKYNITKDIRLKLAAGLYTQNIMSVSSDRDVVNLFYGFITVPEDVADTLNGRKVRNSLQKGQHVVLGWEFDLIPYTLINIEGYFKNFSQLTNINRYKVFSNDDDYLLETGKAYGGDVSVKFDHKGWYVNVVYSLNFVTRNDGTMVYRTIFDRRHNVNLTLSYSWGRRKNWTFDLRWNYGSGFPFTKTKGLYPDIAYVDITGDYIHANEGLGIALDSLNGGQLPDYHRLDISLKRKFYISETCNMDLGIGVSNVYNYANVFYVNRNNDIIYQLPILWSLSYSVTF